MLRTHLLVALRRLRRRPGTTALHVGGLAVGLLCCFLALLFVQDERAYDRHHEHAERVVQLRQQIQAGDATISFTKTPPETVAAIRTEVPGVEAAAVFEHAGTALAQRPGGEAVEVDHLVFADGALFDVLTMPLARGAAALDEPGTVLLTEALAARLFGDPAEGGIDPVGQTVAVTRTGVMTRQLPTNAPLDLTVTGVLADPPAASSLSYDLVVSGATPIDTYDGTTAALAGGGATFVRLAAMSDTTALVDVLTAHGEAEPRRFGEYAGGTAAPLLSLHQRDRVGGVDTLTLFATLATLVVLLACINYANLATALALRRATEVGVRKALGAGRRQLAGQFFAEALLVAIAAGIVGLALTAAVLPSFNALTGKALTLGQFGVAGSLALVGVVLATGLLAGAYPAATLARFRPAAVLKGERLRGRGGRRIRQGLVVVQFAATAVLLGGAALVAEQLRYVQARDLGFHGDQTVVFDLDALGLARERDALRDVMAALAPVRAASVATGVPGEVNMMSLYSPPATLEDRSDDVRTWVVATDAAYAEATGLRLAAGRWLREDEADDAIVLTETAARDLGLMTDDPATALGQQIFQPHQTNNLEVIGVVSDFHFAGLRRDITPLGFRARGDDALFRTLLAVRLASDDLAGGVDALEAAWGDAAPGIPFTPQFLDEAFAEDYAEDWTLARLVGGVALVAAILALFGLLGLSAYAAEQRTKEIGVRKVLGARVGHLVALLAKDFVALVGVALVIAGPVVVVLAQRWLDDFAYPAPLRPGLFAALAVGMVLLAAVTVSVHALRAATADPVHTLRHD